MEKGAKVGAGPAGIEKVPCRSRGVEGSNNDARSQWKGKEGGFNVPYIHLSPAALFVHHLRVLAVAAVRGGEGEGGGGGGEGACRRRGRLVTGRTANKR